MNEPRFAVAHAYRIYAGPPERSLSAVASELGTSTTMLCRMFRERGWPMRPIGRPARITRLPQDVDVDPAVRRLLELAEHHPWTTFDDAVRGWLYHWPQGHGPGIRVVRRNLRRVGHDLAVVPFEELMMDAAD